jgi:hypothetical protein
MRKLFEPALAYAPRSGLDPATLGMVSCLVDAEEFMYVYQNIVVLCVSLPHARLCGTVEEAKGFFREHPIEKDEG